MSALLSTVPHSMRPLITKLDELAAGSESILAAELTGCLEETLACGDWLPESFQAVCEQRYARRLVYADPAGRYSVLALVWAPGQASPVHGHRTWCAVGVYGGELIETSFEMSDEGTVPVARENRARRRGSCSFDVSDGAVHRIANRGAAPAVSLHIYGVPVDRIDDGVNEVYAA